MIVRNNRYLRWWFNASQADQAKAWLDDLALDGWMLKQIGYKFAKFVLCDPASIRYKMILKPDVYTDSEKIKDLLSQSGWNYADDTADYLIFFAPSMTPTPALPEELNKPAAKPSKVKQLLSGIGFLVLGLAVTAGYGFLLNQSHLLSECLLKDNFSLLNFVLIIVSLFALGIGKLYYVFSKPGSLSEQYKRTISWSRIRFVSVTVLFVLGISLPVIDFADRPIELTALPAEVAAISLVDVAPAEFASASMRRVLPITAKEVLCLFQSSLR